MNGEEMHFFDPAMGRRLLRYAEQDAARQAAESRAEAAQTRAEAAESRADRAHAARLAAEAELAALRALLDEKRR